MWTASFFSQHRTFWKDFSVLPGKPMTNFAKTYCLPTLNNSCSWNSIRSSGTWRWLMTWLTWASNVLCCYSLLRIYFLVKTCFKFFIFCQLLQLFIGTIANDQLIGFHDFRSNNNCQLISGGPCLQPFLSMPCPLGNSPFLTPIFTFFHQNGQNLDFPQKQFLVP